MAIRRTAAPSQAAKAKSSAKDGRPRIDERFACFRLRVARSRIHGWGVYAMEPVPAGRKVIEYTGERCNRRETKRRASANLNYMFTLDKYWALDGSVGGSGAEYINHSCDPNCQARIVRGHIIYFSVRDIATGEELTVDYNFDAKVEKVPCGCRSVRCRGTINLLR
ncbi:MAG TPA: SET domain-containing protein-lysine N-methyltransferase, partial [Bryobacteraceae bacterium]|nr:SET domain-containing protein-lysine N-methyltransferase [Bryobacteraceae bacterium]